VLCDVLFFFFQAEDGIRDLTVTGVQTCALPISAPRASAMESGTAFVDARGAVWLPAPESGPGPLRRRAEISDLRTAVANAATARHAAAATAETERAALASAERGAIVAQEAASQAARESADAADRA